MAPDFTFNNAQTGKFMAFGKEGAAWRLPSSSELGCAVLDYVD